MAIDTNQSGSTAALRAGLRGLIGRAGAVTRQAVSTTGSFVGSIVTPVLGPVLGPALRPLAGPAAGVWRWLAKWTPARLFSASLVRRILVSNLIGLVTLLVGILYLSQQNAWLIRAKLDSLRVQGEIIAAALAASAMVETDRLAFQPDRLPEVEGQKAPFRDDGFAKLELSLRPDRVAPVLRRLIGPTNTRARVYGLDGTRISDTSTMLGRSMRGESETEPQQEPAKRVRTRNTWTRIMAWVMRSELPVYKDIGAANGTAYAEVRAALLGSGTGMLLLNDDFEQIVSIAVPIQRKNSTIGALMLSTRPGEIDETLARERSAVLAVAMLAGLVTLLTSFLLWRTIAVPMRNLAGAARQVSQSINARAELPAYSDRQDEVGRMATAFREMTEALYDRIEASERFAADVAHELKNPLTAANAVAQTLSYARTEEDRNELVSQLRGELSRLNRMITEVSNASRLEAELARQETEPVDLRVVASRVVSIFSDLISDGGRRVDLEIADVPLLSDTYVVRGHDLRLGQIATNLVDNALSFSPENGRVRVRLRPSGDHVELVVEDQGPGIPDDKLEKIFERFYSDRPQTDQIKGRNSGLGLSIVRNIVKAHGGRIWAENIRPEGMAREGMAEEGGDRGRPIGARFIVRLPSLAAVPPASRRV